MASADVAAWGRRKERHCDWKHIFAKVAAAFRSPIFYSVKCSLDDELYSSDDEGERSSAMSSTRYESESNLEE